MSRRSTFSTLSPITGRSPDANLDFAPVTPAFRVEGYKLMKSGGFWSMTIVELGERI
jgi:hypothetical protein